MAPRCCRPFQDADAAEVQRLAGAAEVARTTATIPHPYPAGAAERWIAGHAAAAEAGHGYTWAITSGEDGCLLGAIGLAVTSAHRRAELGFWIGLPYWNRGFCSEAAATIRDFAFKELALHKLSCCHMTGNPASGRVMQKIGMQQEGLLRGHFCKDDGMLDLAVYGLLRVRV